MFKKIYTEPTVCIENVVVENGIASSTVWGTEGMAGKDGEFGMYTDDL